VALDTEITEELELMGLARELVSRIQTVRKESGLEITDRIVLHLNASGKLADAIRQYETYIMEETLAVELNCPSSKPGVPYAINELECELALEKSGL